MKPGIIEDAEAEPVATTLRAHRIGLSAAGSDQIAVMRHDCPVCRSEGLASRAQVALRAGGREIVVSLLHSSAEAPAPGEIGLSESAWQRLGVSDGDPVEIAHAQPLASLAEVRRRIYGNRLSDGAFSAIITDIAERRYSDVHLSAFVTACSAVPLDTDETISLTRAMVDVGERLQWPGTVIVDKHSVGGLPGNRTTPIIVSIMAAEGLIMPKTSSRAITSPAGTADTMEVLAPVDLDVSAIRKVVEREGGCIAWGGAVNLSPADDVIIGVERVLDIDAVGQMVASVLSKKIAAGATHLVIDIPVGPTAKVRGADAADTLERALSSVAQAFGLRTRVMRGPAPSRSDGASVRRSRRRISLPCSRGSRAPRISPTGPASWREDCLSSRTQPRPAKAMRVRGRASKAAGPGPSSNVSAKRRAACGLHRSPGSNRI